MELIDILYKRLVEIQCNIDWHQAQLRTFRESDHYNANPVIQKTETSLAHMKIERLRNEKETALHTIHKAIGNEITANAKLIA